MPAEDPREFREDVMSGPVSQGWHQNTSQMLRLIEILFLSLMLGGKGVEFRFNV